MCQIELKGVRVNNLKNINISIPRNKFVVIAGVSGSGKSSLAFDTLYAEGQRRYVESLSSYARQFLGRMGKPEYDFINGLPPAIAIEQRVISRNPRSTVGTSTEIYEYLRMLFAHIGKTYSPISGQEVKRHTINDIINCTHQYSQNTRFLVLAPIHIISETLSQQLKAYYQGGYQRLYTKGKIVAIDDVLRNIDSLSSTEDISLVIDRLAVSYEKENLSRLIDSVETAMYEGHGSCTLVFIPSNLSYTFSNKFEADGITFEEPNDNMFSFNSPTGACSTCEGFGNIVGIDEKLVIPNSTLSVYDGCVKCWHGEKMKVWKEEFCQRATSDNFPIFAPYNTLSQSQKDMLWHGLPSEESKNIRDKVCIDSFFQMVKDNQYKIQYRVMLSCYRGRTICPDCHGGRLKKEANWVKISGRSITDLIQMPIGNLLNWFKTLELSENEQKLSKRLLIEITNRLDYLCQVGLQYLTLNRPSNTLSGGESQRISLTTAIGSSLVGSLYILDEPSIGLHSRDTQKLIKVLKKLQQLGNTVVVVEHDEEIMRAADYLIDVGPDAGSLGGTIVFEGDTSLLSKSTTKDYPNSHTVKYLSGDEKIPVPLSRRPWNRSIWVKGARMNNLKGINVQIPLNVITVVTGVSGSGKSSLIKGILYPAMKRRLDEVADLPGEYLSLEGDVESIKHIEFVDQNPIGKSTRSNPATYVKAYDAIRQLYADQPLSHQMGYTAQHFSFNAEGGRCEECKGAGVITVEMQFMADLVLKCDACHGKRFQKDILDVMFHGKNIYDVLNMTITEAIDFFSKYGQNNIVNKLKPLQEVGLGYIKLGQNSSTLSGGENQRVKLAYFIGQEKVEPTLFIFDEPTTGLHFHDIQKLLNSFNALVKRGHTILIIEHNLEIIKISDWVIDLGPEGGDKGGNLLFEGTPEDLVKCRKSITGQYLSDKMKMA